MGNIFFAGAYQEAQKNTRTTFSASRTSFLKSAFVMLGMAILVGADGFRTCVSGDFFRRAWKSEKKNYRTVSPDYILISLLMVAIPNKCGDGGI